MYSALLIGLVAGFAHVISGIDHLAAIIPLTIQKRVQQWIVGFRWGLGHASGTGLAFLLVWAVRSALNLEMISAWNERLVGLSLILVGFLGVSRVMRRKIHSHTHSHEGVVHEHVHYQADAIALHDGEHKHEHLAFGVGIFHGMAGTSHLLGVVPALLLPSKSDAVVYMAAFSFSTVCAMTLVSAVLGYFTKRWVRDQTLLFEKAILVSCLFTIAVGGVWLGK